MEGWREERKGGSVALLEIGRRDTSRGGEGGTGDSNRKLVLNKSTTATQLMTK